MMDAYQLLRREIRQYIFEEGWSSLRKIQEASIQQVHLSQDNLILAAPTASGKTEAAFLPAINAVEDWEKGLKIVYVSPLIALINDQFQRIQGLCDAMNIPVTAWHSEASRSKKKKLVKEPSGILLITPESIEAMLSLRPYEARYLFKEVEWVIVDEIHSFLDNNRGLQLKSLLERIQVYMKHSVRFIGMSATLHRKDYLLAKKFFNNQRDTKVLLDKSRNELVLSKSYFPENISGKSPDALQEIFDYSQIEAMLIFPNSRKQVENISVSLNHLAKKRNTHVRYFAHHASISKNLRQETENFAKNSRGQLFSIVCTSTLELGIDIGAVDSIVQYNAPHSVSSLAQRLGRSGRQTGKNILHFIATEPWSLLQGLAAISLYEEGNLDPIDEIKKPYDVLAHQILSLLLEKQGIPCEELKLMHQKFASWSNINEEEYHKILKHLIDEGYIEILEGEGIAGIETERLLKRGEFFAHFKIEHHFSVYHGQRKIGEMPVDSKTSVGQNIFLAGKVWTIQSILQKNRKIIVDRAITGGAPDFTGSGAFVSNEIRERMLQILKTKSRWPVKSSLRNVLEILSEEISNDHYFKWTYLEENLGLRTFKGTKINETLLILLRQEFPNTPYTLEDNQTLIYGKELYSAIDKIRLMSFSHEHIETYLHDHPIEVERLLLPYKYSQLLPQDLKIKYIVYNLLDLEGTLEYLKGQG